MAATGKLATGTSSAGAWTVIYTVPVNHYASANISFLNATGSNDQNFKFAISDAVASSPPKKDILSSHVTFPAEYVENHTGRLMGAGESVRVFADSDDISVRVEGFEKLI